MVRAVSSDHIMFQECIEVFRPISDTHTISNDSEKEGYLLLDFNLPSELNFNKFKIAPTHNVKFSFGPYSSFVAPVVLLDYKGLDSHLYVIALSSLVSFITSRPAKAPRDSYTGSLGYETLALQFPHKVAGTGYVNTFLADNKIQEFASEINEVVELLYELPYEYYERFMQSIRLINLAHNNKRDDFALAYYLLVSAIEGIAQMAIPPEINKDPQEDHWEELAKEHKPLKSLLAQFRNYRENSGQLMKRFTNFILKYCPESEWLRLEHHEEERMAQYENADQFGWQTKKQWDEVYPEDFKTRDIKKVIEDTYRYRSKFTHEGKGPPHRYPEPYHRFFETIHTWDDEKGPRAKHLINYRLLAFIAKNSILEYMRDLYKQLRTVEK
ncbi:hypothetical protein [Peribacillus frigoritolerans]|uniref:hypothetical protein n=1 Tax=Peribacillus frigoritolerans TaxID=450367 RepID=UPI0020BE5299|nr:hypothetical protein [Peribacillus frigoritolerans]